MSETMIDLQAFNPVDEPDPEMDQELRKLRAFLIDTLESQDWISEVKVEPRGRGRARIEITTPVTDTTPDRVCRMVVWYDALGQPWPI